MKIFALSALLAASLSSVTFADTIRFEGKIDAQTCNVSLNGNPGSTIVVMPTVSSNDLATAGATAGETPFTLEFSHCSGAVNASVLFAGYSFNYEGRLINEGTAANLTIQVIDSISNNIINFNSPTGTISSMVDISTGTATIPFTAKYYAEDAVSAGTVLATTGYAIAYE